MVVWSVVLSAACVVNAAVRTSYRTHLRPPSTEVTVLHTQGMDGALENSLEVQER